MRKISTHFSTLRMNFIPELAPRFISLSFVLIGLSGCGLLFGNVKPIEGKSDSYRVLDLSRENTIWERVLPNQSQQNESPQTQASPPPQTETKAQVGDTPRENTGEISGSSETGDVAFQSKETASIISLNSACRPSYETQPQDLKALTRQLLFGISEISTQSAKEITLVGEKALDTTTEGKLNGERTRLRTIVVRKAECVYDLMYVSRPENFEKEVQTFDRFVSSLRLK